MKRLLLILIPFLLYSCGNYQASRGPADWIYVSQTGNDVTGDGSSGTPYATIYKAASTASSGDTIYVVAGTITETAQTALPVGVSIYGAGAASIITTADALDPIIKLASVSEGTNGNQSISYIQIDGDLTALTLIEIYARSNISIHHCTFIDALNDGIIFHGRTDDLYQFATTYSTGNTFHDNTVTNCARYALYDTWRYIHGNLCMGGQSGMLIYNNVITQPDRGDAAHGAAITFANWGNHKGTKIYDNILSTVPKKAATSGGGGYAFAVELWSQRGGIEIMRNVIQGAIDIGGYDTNDDGGYGYAIKIYQNHLYIPALSAYDHNLLHFELGIHDGSYVYRNYFENVSRPITFSTTSSALVQGQEDITFSYNVFNNVRRAGAGWYGYCFDVNPSVAFTMDNVQVLNCVAYAPASTFYSFFDSDDAGTTFNNCKLRNNIVCNAHEGVRIINGTIDSLFLQYNYLYNVTNDTTFTDATQTNRFVGNNTDANPLFRTGNFRLQSGSPCRDAGVNVSLTSDYAGHAVPQNTTPDIGAFEYGDYLVCLPSGNLLRNANGKLMYIH